MKLQKNSILVIIVLSQFLGTSLWFAGNGVMADLIESFSLTLAAVGHLTSAVQFGFISGTLVFALLTLADRYSPSKVFFISACLGAACNLGVIHSQNTFLTLFLFRFATGFFLAGIYPVGMKIAADYFREGLGKSLGFLVGALVVGTALPHLLNSLLTDLPWRAVIIVTSILSVVGGFLILTQVPDGPHRTPGKKPDFTAWFRVFRNRDFRSAAFGYFGHMWELYAFWAFVPLMIASYFDTRGLESGNTSILTFFIIGLGGVSCAIGGILSRKTGTKQTAFVALLCSCLCCLLYPPDFQSVIRSSVYCVSPFLGIGCNCRFTPLFHVGCTQCTRRDQRHRSYHRQLYRFFDHDCEYTDGHLAVAICQSRISVYDFGPGSYFRTLLPAFSGDV